MARSGCEFASDALIKRGQGMQILGNSALDRPVTAWHAQARLPAVSFLAHTPYLVLVVAYALIIAAAGSYSGLSPSDTTLTAFIATAIVALPVLLLAVVIIEFYRMARY